MPFSTATTFADDEDRRKFEEAVANGATFNEALRVGDPQIGAWGNYTGPGSPPQVALPPGPGVYKGRLVEIVGPKGRVVAQVGDKGPSGVIDLNPSAAAATGISGKGQVEWNFLDGGKPVPNIDLQDTAPVSLDLRAPTAPPYIPPLDATPVPAILTAQADSSPGEVMSTDSTYNPITGEQQYNYANAEPIAAKVLPNPPAAPPPQGVPTRQKTSDGLEYLQYPNGVRAFPSERKIEWPDGHGGTLSRASNGVVTYYPPSKPEEAGVQLTERGLDIAANNYAATGQLPPMGMGKVGAAIRSRIINRAAELHPELDLASARADYAANKVSLSALQKQRDALTAFEQTAGKNIDIFLQAAGKVVDTGSPLANKVLRTIASDAFGSPDVAAFDAARRVAVNEIAKIVSNPTLAGQLSDSARREVESFNPSSATLKQSVNVMRLLKRDMENRQIAYDGMIKEIKDRIAHGGQASGSTNADSNVAATPTPTPAPAAKPQVMKDKPTGKYFIQKPGGGYQEVDINGNPI